MEIQDAHFHERILDLKGIVSRETSINGDYWCFV
jgi:hypothetical protein